MDRFEFFKRIPAVKQDQRQQIQWAYTLAEEWHKGQKRDTGEDYLEHVVSVANILIDYGYDKPEDLILALLHDCPEDTPIPVSMLEQLFGPVIAKEIISLSKTYGIEDVMTGFVTRTPKCSKEDYYSGICMAGKRVILVKCADRIHNLITLPDPILVPRWTREKRLGKVNETRQWLIPLAQAHEPRFAEELIRLCDQIDSIAA